MVVPSSLEQGGSEGGGGRVGETRERSEKYD